MRMLGLVFVLLGAIAGLMGQTTAPALRVLFLGNSLTDGNNVPGLVQAMAELQGVRLEYTAVTPGGHALEDHWDDNRQALLWDRHFDVLVLQQGPSTQPASQTHLREWTKTWADEARRFGTEPALYMPWPVRTQASGFRFVSQSYRSAALAADAAIFPAGEVWERVLQADSSIRLHSSDDLHATPAGSFLAAMVIARGLVALDPAKVPARVGRIAVPADTLDRFRTAVAAIEAHSFAETSVPDAPLPETESPSIRPAVNPIPLGTPDASAKSGGGGAASGWFLLALAAATALRMNAFRSSRSSLGSGRF